MTALAPLTLDVRSDLRGGGEPLPKILQAVAQLKPDQPLRLLTTFEPIPLYSVLGRKGFAHATSHIGEGDWEILFTPGNAPADGARKQRAAPNGAHKEQSAPASAASASTDDWPSPKTAFDNRGLLPPEPMIRILEALEHLKPGEVLEAINEREPMFLYPELEKRGAAIRTEKRSDGAFRLLIRQGD